jgi:hypothetical protein
MYIGLRININGDIEEFDYYREHNLERYIHNRQNTPFHLIETIYINDAQYHIYGYLDGYQLNRNIYFNYRLYGDIIIITTFNYMLIDSNIYEFLDFYIENDIN